MKTIIYTSALGVICMLTEMFNLRKFIVPITVTGLLLILGVDVMLWGVQDSFYHNMLVLDNYGTAFTGLLILLTTFIVLLAGSFYKSEYEKISDYISITIFTLAGAIALVTFGNLATFFLGIEILSISLYILAASKRKDIRSNEAGMKYFLMGSFASGILLFGIALLYGETASFDLQSIAAYTSNHEPTSMLYTGVVLILIAMLFKVSAAPFHFWAPDVYEGAPTLTTAFMATVAKIAAFAAFYRLFSSCFVPAFPLFENVLAAVAALTITIGNITALSQESFKRMLAFSGISHAGYLLLAIISLYGKTDNALFYYSFAYGLSNIAAFAVAIIVSANTGSEKFESFNGLGKTNPFLAAALTISMLSMAGIPPLAGFFGKYFIFSEAIRTNHILLVIVAIVNSIISVYYYMKVIIATYTKSSDSVVISVKRNYAFVIAVCLLLVLVAGVFPGLLSALL